MEIASQALQLAQAVYAFVQLNKQVYESLDELEETLLTIQQTIKGLQSVPSLEAFSLALKGVQRSLERANVIFGVLAARKGLNKILFNPTHQLEELASINEKLLKHNALLGTSLAAQMVRDGDSRFHATQLLTHPSAKTFWTKHFGSETEAVSWQRFKSALSHEFSSNFRNTFLQTADFEIMRSHLDPDERDSVTVYVFDDFTAVLGVFGSLQAIFDPPRQHLIPSEGTREELIDRTMFVRFTQTVNLYAHQLVVKRLCEELERYGTLHRFVRSHESNGIFVEFKENGIVRTVLDKFESIGSAIGRDLRFGLVSKTCDEIWEDEYHRRVQCLYSLRKNQMEQSAYRVDAAKIEMEVKLLEERRESIQHKLVHEHAQYIQKKKGSVTPDGSKWFGRLPSRKSIRQVFNVFTGSAPDNLAEMEDEEADDDNAAMSDGSDDDFTQIEQDLRQRDAALREEIKSKLTQLKNLLGTDSLQVHNRIKLVPLKESSKPLKVSRSVKFEDSSTDDGPDDSSVVSDHEDRHAHSITVDFDLGSKEVIHSEVYATVRVKFSVCTGKLYFTNLRMVFHSFLLSEALGTSSISFSWREIVDMKCKNVLFLRNTLVVQTTERKYFFRHIFDPQTVYKTAVKLWSRRETSDVFKTGYLIKMGKIVKSWKSRWFKLTNDCLTYSRSPECSPSGTVLVKDITGVKDTEFALFGRSFCFQLLTSNRVYLICARDAVEKVEWMQIINDLVRNNWPVFNWGLLKRNSSGIFQPRMLQVDFNEHLLRNLREGQLRSVHQFNDISDVSVDPLNPLHLTVTFLKNKSFSLFLYSPAQRDRLKSVLCIARDIETKKPDKAELLRLVEPCIMQGFAKLKSTLSWRYHWVTLHSDFLLFFDFSSSTRPVGILNISTVTVAVQGLDLQLITEDTATILPVRFISESDRDAWCKAICDAKQRVLSAKPLRTLQTADEGDQTDSVVNSAEPVNRSALTAEGQEDIVARARIATASVQYEEPSILELNLVGDMTEGRPMTVEGVFVNCDITTCTFQWYRLGLKFDIQPNGNSKTTELPIPIQGAMQASYIPRIQDVSYFLRVEVRPWHDDGAITYQGKPMSVTTRSVIGCNPFKEVETTVALFLTTHNAFFESLTLETENGPVPVKVSVDNRSVVVLAGTRKLLNKRIGSLKFRFIRAPEDPCAFVVSYKTQRHPIRASTETERDNVIFTVNHFRNFALNESQYAHISDVVVQIAEAKMASGEKYANHTVVCSVAFERQRFKTAAVKREELVRWGESATFHVVPLHFSLEVVLTDKGGLLDTLIGKVTVQSKDVKFPSDQWFPVSNQAQVRLLMSRVIGNLPELPDLDETIPVDRSRVKGNIF